MKKFLDRSFMQSRIKKLEDKLDEALAGIEFIRRHMTTYIGRGKAITYLADGMPMYVNSDDYGPPANYINGGVYEQDNFEVLASFVREDTVFLDIGANLGFFSLQLARRINSGKIHAFEPHPLLANLFMGSAYLNGFSDLRGMGRIEVHQMGVGNANGATTFSYPEGHLGGGAVGACSNQQISAEIRRLDDLFGPDFTCDLVKIDVEGHEPQAIEGMQAILARSLNVTVLFEKLEHKRGYEEQIEKLFKMLDMNMYGVLPGAVLSRLEPGKLDEFNGYVVASRAMDLHGKSRCHFSIFPRQMFTAQQTFVSLDRNELVAEASGHGLLAHGPYWRLRSGIYRITLNGLFEGNVTMTITSRFGHPVEQFLVSDCDSHITFVCRRDLLDFECVLRSGPGAGRIRLNRIDFERIG